MNNPYLLVGLSKTPPALRRLFAHIPPEKFDAILDPERFTLRESICHLADWEAIFLERMAGTVSQPGFVITLYDEEEFVVTHNYAEQKISDALDRFDRARQDTLTFLKGIQPEDWSKTAEHPVRGPITVFDQAIMVLGHDLYHIEQFTEGLG